MAVVQIFLIFAAFVLFVLAAFPIPAKVGLGWLGAACGALALLIPHIH